MFLYIFKIAGKLQFVFIKIKVHIYNHDSTTRVRLSRKTRENPSEAKWNTLNRANRSPCDHRSPDKLIPNTFIKMPNVILQHFSPTSLAQTWSHKSGQTDALRSLLIRHYNLTCFSSFNNISIAKSYPWKHIVLCLDLPGLKVSPPTKITGVRWKVWGSMTAGVLLFLWLECTIRTWLKCYLLTLAARHWGG